MFKKILLIILLIPFILLLLAGYVKGEKGVNGAPLYYQTEKSTKFGGPFEASNSTSRYALTESIVENNSLTLNQKLAKFSSPDLVDYKGKFISIFTPGVSFVGVPFYMLGKLFGTPQLFTYFLTTIVAVMNVFLIAVLSKKFGTGLLPGIIAGLIFLFASNGLTYSFTFTQHHLSSMIVLLAVFCAASKNTFKNYLFFGMLFGAGILIDIPNAFLLTPILLYMLFKGFKKQETITKIQITLRPALLGLLIGIIPFLMIFAWYNYETTGSYTKLGQTIGRSKFFRDNLPPQLSADIVSTIKNEHKSLGLKLPFETRAQLQGLYILLVSNERSWVYYSPILLFGIVGVVLLYKTEKKTISLLVVAIILTNITLYSMFGDPWGGWAFGPRYLIPSAALTAAFIGIVIERFKKNPLFVIVFSIFLVYSVWVNSLGALTTQSIPPKVEAVNLASHIPYTYQYNQQLLTNNFSSSLLYNVFLQDKISANQYMQILVLGTLELFVAVYAMTFIKMKRK